MTVLEQRAYEAIIKMAHKDEPDYWTRLEHTYVGMAMQGILSNYDLLKFLCKDGETIKETVINSTIILSHALVEKMKEERK